MSETPYFDAYVRGERSTSYKRGRHSNAADFDPVLIYQIRRSMPNLVAYDLTGVQPMAMTGPTGRIFTVRNVWNTRGNYR